MRSRPLALVPFVAVDVETTGLDPAREEIVEIGAVKILDGEIVGQYETLVAIDRTIPFAARRVHGISNEMLVGKPRTREAMDLLLEFAEGGPLVEHSWQAFDIAFLERAHGRPLPGPCLNTCTLSRKLFPHIPKHSLEACCTRFRIVNRNPHRALPDARATGELLIKLLELCSARYPLLRDLERVCAVQREARRT